MTVFFFIGRLLVERQGQLFNWRGYIVLLYNWRCVLARLVSRMGKTRKSLAGAYYPHARFRGHGQCAKQKNFALAYHPKILVFVQH
jgi:hypothetical protein